MGLSDCQIHFELYKLLIYETGSFFAAHRDTEKIPNMFATLVVNLPSAHAGGELIVSHASQSQSYPFADSSLFEPSYVAFYADCRHEVKPITSGYRLCLVYNLAIANRRKQLVLSERMGPIEAIDRAIQAWVQEAGGKPILTYLLDHSYSEQNLSLRANSMIADGIISASDEGGFASIATALERLPSFWKTDAWNESYLTTSWDAHQDRHRMPSPVPG